MGAADLHRRILELEEQVNSLARQKRELEEKVEELTPRRVLVATLSSDKPLYWVEQVQRHVGVKEVYAEP